MLSLAPPELGRLSVCLERSSVEDSTGHAYQETPLMSDAITQAAEVIREARALVVSAGAGMGVDSGLPDFRGTEGFWQAYPAYAKLGMPFHELANPRWFRKDPTLAWGFYGHRLNLYQATAPHDGFAVLRRWAEAMPGGAFVFTSNVDGHFQVAGFDADRIVEVHGTIRLMQCLDECGVGLFPSAEARNMPIVIDGTTFRAQEPLPACPSCGGLARPNILMFGDGGWDLSHAYEQELRQRGWYRQLGRIPIAIVECGAGSSIPTVRHYSQGIARQFDAKLIRINLREPQVPEGHIGIAMPARAALHAIDAVLA